MAGLELGLGLGLRVRVSDYVGGIVYPPTLKSSTSQVNDMLWMQVSKHLSGVSAHITLVTTL